MQVRILSPPPFFLDSNQTYCMESKKCSGCLEELSLDCFSFKSRSKGTLQAKCKKCHSDYRKLHYNSNRSYYIKKAKDRRHEDRERNRQFIIDFLSDKQCAACGEDDPVVLEFDHQRDKVAAISKMINECYSIAAILQEIEKCEILCANCHRRKTAAQFGFFKV